MSPFAGKFIEFSEEEFSGSIGIKEFIKRLGIAFKALVKAADRTEVEKVVDLSEGVTLRCSYKNGKYKYTFTDEKGREKTFENHIPQNFNFVEWARGIPSHHSEEEYLRKESPFSKKNVEESEFMALGPGYEKLHKLREKYKTEKSLEGRKRLRDEMKKVANQYKIEKFADEEVEDEFASAREVFQKCGRPTCKCGKSPFGKKRFISEAREHEDEFAELKVRQFTLYSDKDKEKSSPYSFNSRNWEAIISDLTENKRNLNNLTYLVMRTGDKITKSDVGKYLDKGDTIQVQFSSSEEYFAGKSLLNYLLDNSEEITSLRSANNYKYLILINSEDDIEIFKVTKVTKATENKYKGSYYIFYQSYYRTLTKKHSKNNDPNASWIVDNLRDLRGINELPKSISRYL